MVATKATVACEVLVKHVFPFVTMPNCTVDALGTT